MKRPLPIKYEEWDLVVSASQLETADLCHRKWWFKSQHRQPEVDKGFQKFGNAMHSAIERWLEADDCGRMADGSAADPFPPGWDAELDPLEADLLKRLFQLGIEQGLIERLPGRRVEEPFALPVWVEDEGKVAIVGYIDLLGPLQVQDHKTTKNRRYVKSRDELKRNLQMLVYAAVALGRAVEGGLPESKCAEAKVVLRHNAYVKDPRAPRAIKVENEVTGAEVERFWEEDLKPRCLELLALAKRDLKLEQWREVPGPADEHEACNAFGGCPYLTICSGSESPAEHKTRVDSINSGSYRVQPIISLPPATGAPKVGTSIFERLRTAGASNAPATAPAPAQPAVAAPSTTSVLPASNLPAVPVAAPAAPAAAPSPSAVAAPQPPASAGLPTFSLPADERAAPWARPTCSACKGRGFKLKDGKPCIVCAGVARKEGRNQPELFTITVSDGWAKWVSNAEPNQVGAVRLDAGTPKAEARVEAPAPATVPAAAPVSAQAAAPVTIPFSSHTVITAVSPATSAALDEAARIPQAATKKLKAAKEVEDGPGPGRPRRGISLYFDCAVVRGPKDNVRTLTEIIANEIGPEMAKAAGKEHYYQIPFFDRRDTLAMNAALIAEKLGSLDIVVNSSDQDALILGTALETHAVRVIRATR